MDSFFPNDDTLLINSRLYTDDQVKHIQNMRNQYETKIRRKDKAAFFSYISAEKKILQKIQTNVIKSEELIKQAILRIIRIHNIALSTFKEELMFWISYIKFCIEIGNTELVTKTIPLLLDIHKNEEQVWHLAAKWELNKYNNPDKALNYLYKGLNYNPTAASIYIHILHVILSRVTNEEDKKVELKKQNRAEKGAIDLFNKAAKAELDLDVYVKFLKLSSEYNFTKKLQYIICKFLTSKYSDNEDIWHILAQRELEGHHINENNYEFITNINDRIKNCLKLYETTLLTLSTEKMWVTYLDALVDLHKTHSTNELIKKSFISACNEPHKKGFMSEKHYIIWIKLLDNAEQVPQILEFATTHKPDCIQLWEARIKYHFNKSEDTIADNIFDEAIKILGDNSVPIWRRKIQYYQLKGSHVKKIESIYREGLKFSPAISVELQPQFLEWTALSRSRDVMHNLYKDLVKNEPICLELHKKMAELEAMCSDPSEEIFNNIKDCLKEHPEESREWDEYVTQEICFGPSWKSEIYKKFLSTG